MIEHLAHLEKDDARYDTLIKYLTKACNDRMREVKIKHERGVDSATTTSLVDASVGQSDNAVVALPHPTEVSRVDAPMERSDNTTALPLMTPLRKKVLRGDHKGDQGGFIVWNSYATPRKMKRDDRELSPAIHNCTHKVPGEHGTHLNMDSAWKREKQDKGRVTYI